MNSHHPSLHPHHQESHACHQAWQVQSRLLAQRLFDQALRQGWVARFFDALCRRSSTLALLADLPISSTASTNLPGVQSIPLHQIIGSEGRSHDFDRHFAPLHEHIRERWVSLAALRSEGHPLPPVELVQVGHSYYVLDGHHRISVARAFGDATIDACVTVWDLGPNPGARASCPRIHREGGTPSLPKRSSITR
ncbi:hypothetical protein OSCT_2895 [Oscillochloris trichoides DG-6]|uniref:ParB/Sulfiredoxin domain-containing protein n=1 Tax=Oscillochloris trichoides DG-6 TaxID=765420 RepID=E1IHV7_9CHLR|nr:hypothetical protein [Oscillochloris trichoides]EFO79232.1 hypothetical protein OSCT_2895 [Oscillochloris trichoides DG-6]